MSNELPLITCPCCGYKTISDEYEICDICFWENDPIQTEYPDCTGANAALTLRQAQHNFLRYGAKVENRQDLVRRPGQDDQRDPDWKPLTPVDGGE